MTIFVLNIIGIPIFETEFGRARLQKNGYYMITSWKEDNHCKLLHRLIFEKYFGKIPEGFVIHHKDGDKLNNCIFNLQLMKNEYHTSKHHSGAKRPIETRVKISEAMKGKNKHMYGRNHPKWKDYARVVKRGFNKNGKQNYGIKYNGKIIKTSINHNKLQTLTDEINQGGG